jgi:hypothetical protein
MHIRALVESTINTINNHSWRDISAIRLKRGYYIRKLAVSCHVAKDKATTDSHPGLNSTLSTVSACPEGVGWIKVAQDKDQWCALMNTVINFWDLWKEGKFLPAKQLLLSQGLLHGDVSSLVKLGWKAIRRTLCNRAVGVGCVGCTRKFLGSSRVAWYTAELNCCRVYLTAFVKLLSFLD